MTWHEGDVVRKLRSVVGWTIDDLATASGVDAQTIHRIEKGATREAKRSTLDRLGRPFGLSWAEVLALVPPRTDVVIKVRATPPPKIQAPPRRVEAATKERAVAVGGRRR